jgi:hypothetical protein
MIETNIMIGPVREMFWESLSGNAGKLDRPAWHDVEHRIRIMSSQDPGSLFLNAANGTTLSIGGEPDKGFVVFVSRDDENYYLLTAPERRKGKVTLIVGFQPGEYARRIVVNIDEAIDAAHTFFETGRRGDHSSWTVDYKTVEW